LNILRMAKKSKNGNNNESDKRKTGSKSEQSPPSSPIVNKSNVNGGNSGHISFEVPLTPEGHNSSNFFSPTRTPHSDFQLLTPMTLTNVNSPLISSQTRFTIPTSRDWSPFGVHDNVNHLSTEDNDFISTSLVQSPPPRLRHKQSRHIRVIDSSDDNFNSQNDHFESNHVSSYDMHYYKNLQAVENRLKSGTGKYNVYDADVTNIWADEPIWSTPAVIGLLNPDENTNITAQSVSSTATASSNSNSNSNKRKDKNGEGVDGSKKKRGAASGSSDKKNKKESPTTIAANNSLVSQISPPVTNQHLKMPPSISPPGVVSSESTDKVVCNCKKSRCLKLYCDCFKTNAYCDGCNCNDCSNNKAGEIDRNAAIGAILDRNSEAFKPRVSEDSDQGNKGHLNGCHCKKSNCLKKYCECYSGTVFCSDKCRCFECKNNVTGTIINHNQNNNNATIMPNVVPKAIFNPIPANISFPNIGGSGMGQRSNVVSYAPPASNV